MAATENNQWWKLRAKHGRDKIFESPQMLWDSCVEYFEATDNRKWTKKDWVGKDAYEVERKTDTPYTITGLCVFLDIEHQTWRNYGNRDKQEYKDFFEVHARVEQIIYTQKIEGAMVGAFNPAIVAREVGLADKTDITSGGDKLPANSNVIEVEIIRRKDE